MVEQNQGSQFISIHSFEKLLNRGIYNFTYCLYYTLYLSIFILKPLSNLRIVSI